MVSPKIVRQDKCTVRGHEYVTAVEGRCHGISKAGRRLIVHSVWNWQPAGAAEGARRAILAKVGESGSDGINKPKSERNLRVSPLWPLHW